MAITNDVHGTSTKHKYYDSFFIQLETYTRLSTHLHFLNALPESAEDYAFTPNCHWQIYVTIFPKLLRSFELLYSLLHREDVYSYYNSVTKLRSEYITFYFGFAILTTVSMKFYGFFPFKSDTTGESYRSLFYS